ncbi:MAG: fibronectin type III domain-containing protein [Marinobacter sp.]|uniref:fibronectin type III domain-containing protein n=1 Tax=Marinobacter sp. TaxID=50741 RepID=UPI003F982379
MNSVIKMSKAWIAAFAFGALLTGCDGASDPVGESSATGMVVDKPEMSGAVVKPILPGAERTAVLSWSAPDSRVNGDGIKMGELDKYIIHYGQNADELDRKVVVYGAQENANMTHKVSNLGVGTWYFTIQVQDTDGLMSAPSTSVHKQIKS